MNRIAVAARSFRRVTRKPRAAKRIDLSAEGLEATFEVAYR
jgi:hypothetical protein